MKSIFNVFKKGLQKTATSVSRSITSVVTGEKIWDDTTFEELEAMLIAADFGVAATLRIVDDIRDRYERGKIPTAMDINQIASADAAAILRRNQRQINFAPPGNPTVILFVGVNGSGKTTTIGKLAARWRIEGKKVILGASDTFRAAAVEQLKLWAEKTDSDIVAAQPNADPSSVAFDAVHAAQARKSDLLLIDTAGRQHNRKGLMEELAKIKRTINKIYPDAPHETWLTIDAALGANAINQAREFSRIAAVSGLVITKLDGTGKGGMAVALQKEFELPVFFVGFGEQPDDLQPFDPDFYAAALFGQNKLPETFPEP